MRTTALTILTLAILGAAQASAQALWRTAGPRTSWYEPKPLDVREWKEHDHVMIHIDHNANATRDDRFEGSKEYEASVTLAEFIRFGKGLDLNPSDKEELAVDFESELSSRNEGRRRRRSTFSDIVTAEVTQVMDDYDAETGRGKLMLRAIKEVRVGEDIERIELTGRVEAAHIDNQDTIDVERLFDVKINYYGEGDVSDNAKMGWLAKAISSLWPF